MRAMPAFLLMLPAIAMPAPSAYADEPVEASRRVIEQQIDAFLKDDAETAYSFAAPGIKARYPDKEAFFAMVKKSYQPVYHPGNYAFGRSRMLEDGAIVLHELMITGDNGRYWKAFYMMARQADGSYKIGGVVILPDLVNKGI